MVVELEVEDQTFVVVELRKENQTRKRQTKSQKQTNQQRKCAEVVRNRHEGDHTLVVEELEVEDQTLVVVALMEWRLYRATT